MKFISWNIDGVNAMSRNINFANHLLRWKADIIAIQETKTFTKDKRLLFPGYYDYWSFHETCRLPTAQSGTMVLTRHKPRKISTSFPDDPGFDTEGRLIILEFDFYYFVNVYVPNSQDDVAGRSKERSLVRKDYRIRFDSLLNDCVKKMNEEKYVILCGDFNAAISSKDMSQNSKWQDKEGFSKDANADLKQLEEFGLLFCIGRAL